MPRVGRKSNDIGPQEPQELLKLWMTLKDFESVLIILVLALGGSLLATKAAYD
jgi:hypothetical protein